MNSTAIAETAREHLCPALPRATELVFERGEGSYLYTADGEAYLDLVAGIAVCNVGHCHPEVVQAVREQAGRLMHICLVTGYYPSAVRLADMLAEIAPGDLDTVFFANTGAEAIEGALKLARYVTRRPVVIAYRGAFHGRTLAAVSLTSSSVRYRQHYEPLLPSVYHVTYPYCFRCRFKAEPASCDLECFEDFALLFSHQVSPQDVAAVVMEPVLGEGGYVFPPERYVRAVRSLCDEHGILLIFDEIQTGFGRTGKMFAAEHYGVVPDIMCMAKAMASGLPLSAFMARRELMAQWPGGAHGTTFGANPVSCAAAVASLEVITREGLVERSARLGDYLKGRLEEIKDRYPVIGDVRGRGLMVAVEFVKPDGRPNGEVCARVIQRCLERRLLFYPCGTYKQCIRFMPALNIPREDLDRAIEIFAEVISEVQGEVQS